MRTSLQHMRSQAVILFPIHSTKVKLKQLHLSRKNTYLNVSAVGDHNTCIKDVISAGQRFICLLYCSKVAISMNQLRHKIFSSKKNTPQIKALPPTDAA